MTDPALPPLPSLDQTVRFFSSGTAPAPQRSAGVDLYLRSMEDQEKQDEQAWASSMRVAIQTNPGTAAEADRLARQVGLPIGDATQRIDFLRGVSLMERMRQDRIRETNPVLYKSLQSIEFARKAWDDYESLSNLERWGKDLRRGMLTSERGRAALDFTPEGRKRFEAIDAELKTMAPASGGIIGNTAEIVGQWAVHMPRALAGGVAGAGIAATGAAIAGQLGPQALAPEEAITVPVAALAGFKAGFVSQLAVDIATSEGGNAYADMIAAGYDETRAAWAAGGVGIINAALELAGGHLATSATRKLIGEQVFKRAVREAAGSGIAGWGRGFAVEYGKAMAGEVGTEFTQELVNIVAEELAATDGVDNLSPEGVASRLWEVVSKTAQGMALLSVPGGVAGGVRGRYLSEIAKANQKLMAEGNAAAGASKLMQGDPTGGADYVGEVLRQGEIQDGHVDAKAFDELLRKIDEAGAASGELRKSTLDVLEGIVPGISEQLERALEIGGDVTIPLADVVSHIRGQLPEFAAGLEPLLRTAPDGVAAADVTPEGAERVKKAAGEADTGSDAEAQFYDALDKIQREAAAQAFQAGGQRISREQARNAARIYRAAIEQVARAEGLDPEAAAKKYGVTFTNIAEAERPTDALDQPGLKTDTPEFRAWFGESKVVDADGKPLSMYHGGPQRDLQQFKGAIKFFTESKADAEAYALNRIGAPVQSESYYEGDRRAKDLEGRVSEVYLSVRKLLDLETDDGAKVLAGLGLDEVAVTDLAGDDKPRAKEALARAKAIQKRIVGEGIYRWNLTTAPWSDAWDLVLVPALKEAGYDGLRVGEPMGAKSSIAVFDPTQIKSVNNRGTFDPNDPNILRQGERGWFSPSRLAIAFGPESDVSTALHELTHWFVEIVERLDAAGSTYGKTQLDALLAHWKITREQWAGMDTAQRMPLLEDVAHNAEDYFATGKAPSEELRGVFAKLRSFIVSIYRNVRAVLEANYSSETKGGKLSPISDDLRGFFDRMLAAEHAIESERAVRAGSMRLSDATAKAIGIEGEALAEVRSLEDQRVEEAKEDLTGELVRGARYYQAGKRGAEADVKRALKAAEDKIRGEVEREIDAAPVYRALDFIRKGKVEQDGKQATAKLDSDAVSAILGEDAAKLPAGLTRKGGLDPDAMAQAHGFGSGAEMLRAILNAPPRDEAVAARVRERLEAEEPLADPQRFKAAVEKALHGKTALRLAATVLRAMMKGVRVTSQLMAEAREAARVALLRTPVGRINVRAMAAAEFRAAQRRDRAIASGKIEEAIEAQRQFLVQHYLTVEAAKVETEVRRAVERSERNFGKADEQILKERRNLDYVNAGRLIMGRFGMLGSVPLERARADMEQMRELDADGFAKLERRMVDATSRAKAWREVALDEFRVLAADLDGLWSEAHRAEQVRIDGKMRDIAEVRAELEDQAIRTFGGKRNAEGVVEVWEKVPRYLGGDIVSYMTRLEAFTRMVDGGEAGGPWHRYVYQPLKDATVAAELEKAEHKAWIESWLREFGPLSEKIDTKRFFGDGNALPTTLAEVVGLLLHLGTESGERAVVLGNGLGHQVKGDLVTRLPVILRELADAGKITEKHFQQVQKLWDYIAKNLRERVFKTTREVWGFWPKEVEAKVVQTPFGTIPGGYFPAKVDHEKATVQTAAKLEALSKGGRDAFVAANPSVPRGMTIQRQNNVVQPRVLDLGMVGQHMDEAVNIIHLQPAISDMARLFGGRRNTMAATLAQVLPKAQRNIIGPALERMARDTIEAPTNRTVRGIVRWARKGASLAFLGFNPRNAAQQFTGLFNAVPEVGSSRLWSAIREVAFHPGRTVEQIVGKSDAMRARWSDAMQAAAQDIQQILNPSVARKTLQQAQRAAFFLQRLAQQKTDAIVWKAAYEKAVAELGPGMDVDKLDAEAVRRADSAVRLTQGEKTPLDVPAFLSGNAVAQMFTQFADYPNTVLNQNIAAKDGQRFAVFAWTVLAPTLASSAIALTFAFGKIGSTRDQGDPYEERLAKFVFGDQVRGIVGMVPLAGPLAASALNELFGLTNDPGGLRNQPFASWSMIQNLANVATGDAKFSDALAAIAFGIGAPARPLVNVTRYQERIAAGREPQGDVVDYLRVLLNGR